MGPVTFRELLTRFGSADGALDALPEIARRGRRVRPLRIPSAAAAERELTQIERFGARYLGLVEPDYPLALAAIDDAPPLLMLAGNEHLLTRPCIALVGARNASLNGRKLAESLSRELAQEGFLVVSGMARGIDTAAHIGALEAATAAVLAGGLDVIYPPENEALHEDLRSRGLLIGELPLGTEPQARHFPRRNRIISGLSLGVVVIEAAMRSGSLITARFANEQGREVMAVPGSPLDPRARGCNDLLRQGATLVESAEDVVRAIAQQSRPLGEPDFGDFDDTAPGIPSETEVAQAMRTLLELLGPSPTPVDELIRQCQFSSALVRYLLLELEFANRVQRHPGNRVSLLMDPDA